MGSGDLCTVLGGGGVAAYCYLFFEGCNGLLILVQSQTAHKASHREWLGTATSDSHDAVRGAVEPTNRFILR